MLFFNRRGDALRALCIYVDGGKGHYVPARAVSEELISSGVDTKLVEFFDYLRIRWIGWINKKYWRTMLKMPNLEKKLSRFNDSGSNGMELAVKFALRHCSQRLKDNLMEFRPDFVFATHPYASTILAEMFSALDISIPVYYFATDVFSAPVASICPKLQKFYIATEEGAEAVKRMGQDPDTIEICPFPLQKSVAESAVISKAEARKKLGLDESLFTLQLNLGGEGIGSLALLENIIKEKLPVQVVIIGGLSEESKKHIENIATHCEGRTAVYVKGFVSNVNEYLAASDIIAGRAGSNTIVEAIYAHRPFLITELVYTVIPSAAYLEKYHVGWNCENDVRKQMEIVRIYAGNPSLLDEMENSFRNVPIQYSARKLAELVVSDSIEYARNLI